MDHETFGLRRTMLLQFALRGESQSTRYPCVCPSTVVLARQTYDARCYRKVCEVIPGGQDVYKRIEYAITQNYVSIKSTMTFTFKESSCLKTIDSISL